MKSLKKKNLSIFIKIHRQFSAPVSPTCPSNPSNYLSFLVSLVAQLRFFVSLSLSVSLFPSSIHSPRTTRYYESLYLFSSLNSAAMFMLQIFHISVYVYIYTKLLWNVKNDSISKIANLITNRCRCLNLAHSQRLQRICITITVKSRDPLLFSLLQLLSLSILLSLFSLPLPSLSHEVSRSSFCSPFLFFVTFFNWPQFTDKDKIGYVV